MIRLRTIPQIVDLYSKTDPGGYMNQWYLRGLVKSGAFPCHRIGRRILINLDILEEYLANPPAESVDVPTYGKIRKIETR